MAMNLDDLVYKIRVDDSDVETGARSAAQSLSTLNGPTSAVSRGMAGVARDTKLTRQEMMSLQFTVSDTVSSLASGMSPLTILLQQGPQVRDAFGGIGNAIRGIASVITPAAVGFGALAVAGGAVATAFIQGYTQADQLEKAINRTGNAAGVTAGQFDAMVKTVAAAGDASEASSRKILLGLVQTGQVGPQALQPAAAAAAAMAKAYGMTEAEVVKSFQGMQKGVAAWAAEQNKTMNFLTLEQYRYIRALEEQGKKTEAQIKLFELLGAAAGRVTGNLGTLERGWDAVGRAASGAWQFMLGIGRESTLEDRLAKAQAALSEAEKNLADPANSGPFNRQLVRGSQAEVEAKRETVRLLQQQIAGQRTVAAEQAATAAANRKAIEDEIEREKLRKGPRQRAEIGYAITDPIADQRQAFLRSEIEGRGATDKALADRDAKAIADRTRAIESLLSQTNIARAERLREQLRLLNEEFQAQGETDSGSKLGQAIVQVEQQLRDLEPVAKQTFDGLSVFADQAARNIQDGLGNTLEMALSGNFQNIGKMWVQLLQRMVAQAAAAKLNEQLFGGSGGNAGNALLQFVGTAFSAFGGSYNGSSGINGGSTILPNSLRGGAATGANALERDMITLVHKGEAIVPKAYNPAAGGKGAGVTINQTINASPGTDRNALVAAMQQAKDAAVAEVFDAMRRGRAGAV